MQNLTRLEWWAWPTPKRLTRAELSPGAERVRSSGNQIPLPDRLSQLQRTERTEGRQVREGPSPRHFPLGHLGGYETSALQSTLSLFLSYSGASPPWRLTTEHRLQKPGVGRRTSLGPGDFGKIFQRLGPL